jgi:hypothetical protein
MAEEEDPYDTILRTQVRRNPESIGVLSSSEYLAVALVLDRPDLWQQSQYPTALEAVSRLGRVWQEAALRVQRAVSPPFREVTIWAI